MALQIISNFPERLNEALGDMSLTKLAINIGMSKQSISAYLSGTRIPKQPTIKAISEFLNVAPAWLMGYDVEKTPSKTELVDFYVDDNEKKLLKYYRICSDEDREELIAMARYKSQKCIFRPHPDSDSGNIRTAFRNYPDNKTETSGQHFGTSGHLVKLIK